MTIIRIDKYTDKEKNLLPPVEATYRRIILYNEGDNNPSAYQTEYSKDGFDVDFKESTMIYYEGDETPELMEIPDEKGKPKAKRDYVPWGPSRCGGPRGVRYER